MTRTNILNSNPFEQPATQGFTAQQVAELTEQITRKVSEDLSRKYQEASQEAAHREKFSSEVRAQVIEWLKPVVAFTRASERLAMSNTPQQKLSSADRETYFSLKKASEEALDEMVETVSEGQEARGALIEDLVEEAGADPEIAAQIISEEMGKEVTPQNVDAVTEKMADDAVLASTGNHTKESASAADQFAETFASYPPLTQHILSKTAANKLQQRIRAETSAQR